MIRTLAEIDATVRKAMRGHGCPWGLAEEAGKAARWLASHDLPADRVMVTLAASRDACCCGSDSEVCALRQATALADRACTMTEPVTIATEQPLLVLAQMGRAADALDNAFTIEWSGASTGVSRNALALEVRGDLCAPTSALTCRSANGLQGTPPSPASRVIDSRAWKTLDELAQRILVPASDLSRAGAGASQSDND